LAVSDGKAAVAKAYELSGGAPWLTVPRESERKPELTPCNNRTITVNQSSASSARKNVTGGAKLGDAVVTE
jgi:hypothetical protein